MDVGKPLYLEVARHLGPGTDNLADPAFNYYHALLEMDCSDPLQEPGNNTAAGLAKPVSSFLAAMQAGSVSGSCLLPCSTPAGYVAHMYHHLHIHNIITIMLHTIMLLAAGNFRGWPNVMR